MQVDRQWQDALLCQAGGHVFVPTLRAEGKARRGDALASDGALGLLCMDAVSVDVCSAVVLARVTATGWRRTGVSRRVKRQGRGQSWATLHLAARLYPGAKRHDILRCSHFTTSRPMNRSR